MIYVVDARAALELATLGYVNEEPTELFAPTLLRSQVFAIARGRVARGQLQPTEALELAERACRIPDRLLGDAVLRKTAWRIATEQGWPETYEAEYIALTQLHGKALISADEDLRTKASNLVPTDSVSGFLSNSASD